MYGEGVYGDGLYDTSFRIGELMGNVAVDTLGKDPL